MQRFWRKIKFPKQEHGRMPLLTLGAVLIAAFCIGTGGGLQEPQIFTIGSKSELLFIPRKATAKEVKRQFHCDASVNGSYFGFDKNGNFFPAGIWITRKGKQSYPNTEHTDPNLKTSIRFYQHRGMADFFFYEKRHTAHRGTITFNAGPWLLRKGRINPDVQQDISHRSLKVPRSIIAKKKNHQLFLILFTQGIDLHISASHLKKEGFYDAINLDGVPLPHFLLIRKRPTL